MRMWQRTLPGVVVLLAAAACKPAQQQQAAQQGPARRTREWKIQDAMSAAPAELAQGATIMDWPSTPNGQPTQLRAGTNGWTCFPDEPNTPSDDPMCLDQQWMAWAQGWMSHTPPNVTAVGYAYMLKGGDAASMTDPFKMRPDSGQQWGHEGPHVMMVVPASQVASLSSAPDHPQNNGPWVMWKNTPYVHVMMPVGAGGMH